MAAGEDESPITSFWGEHRFLSNFFPAAVSLDGEPYRSVEHAYHEAKSTDHAVRQQIAELEHAADVKRFARTMEVRPDWAEVRLGVMGALLVEKFTDPTLRELLRRTGCRWLEEHNTWGDVFWGICNGVGENHLGRLLMGVRDGLDGVRP